MNTGLNMTIHHLLAIYSGGKLDLSGAGYQPNSGLEGPGAGIGKHFHGNGLNVREVLSKTKYSKTC